jgi:hypothetical protein
LFDCFLWAVFFLIIEVALTGGQLFPATKSYVLIWARNRLGYTLGDFLTNTSGHTGIGDRQMKLVDKKRFDALLRRVLIDL